MGKIEDGFDTVLERLVMAVSRDLRAEGEWQAQDARKELYAALAEAKAHLGAPVRINSKAVRERTIGE